MMLNAYALENFCKGRLAAKLSFWEREDIKNKGRLPKEFQTHDLMKLVEDTGVVIEGDQEDEELLRRLRLAAEWRGRYPVTNAYRSKLSVYSWRS